MKNIFSFVKIKNIRNKKAIVWSELAWWIIGLIVLVLIIFVLWAMSKQGAIELEWLKALMRFGR